MDMNLDSLSFVGFGADRIGLMATLFSLPIEHIDVHLTPVGCTNIVLPWSSQKNMTCVHVNHITSNKILVKFVN